MSNKTKAKRELALAAVRAVVSHFVYYDRKDDEDLSVEDLEEVLIEHPWFVVEATLLFSRELERYVEGLKKKRGKA